MKKLTFCKTATVVSGLLAIAIYARPEMNIEQGQHDELAGAALGLISAIFGTQWVEYQKRQDAASNHPGPPAWVRWLLFSFLFGLTMMNATAQTTWTARPQSPKQHELLDMAYGAGRYVAVGDYGIIRVSTDGESWTTQTDGLFQSNSLSGIIYAKNQFVTVGTNGRVMTSANGLSWTTQVSGTNEALLAIAYGGGKFVAVGWNGVIITSTDGVTWTNQVSGTPYIFTDVAYGGGKFVAVGQFGLVETSTDGVTWVARTLPVSGFDLRGITAGPNGSFVAVGGLTVIVTSTDGTTWTLRPVAGPALFLTDVVYNSTHNRYVATSNASGKLVTSLDGVTWKVTSSGTPLILSTVRCLQDKFLLMGQGGIIRSSSTTQWSVASIWKPVTIDPLFSLHGAAFGNGHYVAVGTYSADYHAFTANVAVTSPDGINYTVGETFHFPNGDKPFNDVAFGNGLFVAVGEDAIIQTSADGKVWDFRQVVAGQTLNAVTYGGGQFVAIGDNGFISRSNDGKTWSQGFTGLWSKFNGLTFANGQFVAVGTNGTIATSPNGITWTARLSGTAKQLKSVAFGNSMWLAVGYDGIACWSMNGTTWTSYTVDANAHLNHVMFANGQFVAVGLNGKIFTFPNAFIGTARVSKTSAHLWGIMHGANQFVAVGEPASQDDWTTAIVVTSPDSSPTTAAAQPTSPNTEAQARLATSEPEVRLQAMSYPNPVEEAFTISIEGASGQAVRLWLVDGQGRTVEDRQIQVDESQHKESMHLGQREPGMYLLRVSTADQTQTLKVLKQ